MKEKMNWMKEDWIQTINANLGYCYTLDLTKLNHTLVPIMFQTSPSKPMELIGIELDLRVRNLNSVKPDNFKKNSWNKPH